MFEIRCMFVYPEDVMLIILVYDDILINIIVRIKNITRVKNIN